MTTRQLQITLPLLCAVIALVAFSGCEKDCSKNYAGQYLLSNDAILWVPAPTEREFRMRTQGNHTDTFSVTQSTPGPSMYNGLDEQRCEAYEGQNFTIDVTGDSTGFELYSTVTSNQVREIVKLGIPDFAVSVDIEDFQIVELNPDIGNINGEIAVFDTLSFGSTMYFDVIRINILDPENRVNFSQFHYAKSVGFVQVLQDAGWEWIRE